MPHQVTRTGRLSSTQIAVLLALVHGVHDALTAIVGVLLPTLRGRLELGPTTLALLVAVFAVSSSATQPVLGALADRLGLRQFAAGGVAVSAVSLSLIGPVTSTPLLVVLLTLGGLGSAALHPIATSIVGGPHSRDPGLAVGLFTAGGMVGFAIGPVIILSLIAAHGPEATAWLMVPGLLLAALVWWLLPDYEPHAGRGGPVAVINKAAINRRTVAITLVMGVAGLVLLAFTSSVPLWLVAEHQVEPDAPLLGWTLGAFSLAAGLGAVGGGVLAARMGAALVAGGSLVFAAFGLGLVVSIGSGPGLVPAAAGTGFLLFMCQPLLVLAAQRAAPDAPTAAAGLVLGGGGALAGLLYLGAGPVQSTVGLGPSLLLSASALLPVALLAAAVLRAPAWTGTGHSRSPDLYIH